MSNRLRWWLGALCLWTVFVWGNRLSNAWSSTTESSSAKAISTVLAASFIVFALAGVALLMRSWSTGLTRSAGMFLVAFAGWTIVVWCVRIVAIAVGDHGAAFKIVHVLLGLISIGLAIGVARAVRRAPVDAISTAA